MAQGWQNAKFIRVFMREPTHHTKKIQEISPITPPPITNHTGLISALKSRTSETRAIKAGIGSKIESRPSCQVTPAMSANETTFAPSSKPARIGDSLKRGMRGPVTATKTNAGKKMPTVANSAPGTPASKYPTKVAVVETGPGVTWPTATASKSSWSLKRPGTTNSDRKKARST